MVCDLASLPDKRGLMYSSWAFQTRGWSERERARREQRRHLVGAVLHRRRAVHDPGLALFYAGMVSRRNTLVMLQQNFDPARRDQPDLGDGRLQPGVRERHRRTGSSATSKPVRPAQPGGTLRHRRCTSSLRTIAIPTLAFVAYQMMFAVITPALATGAVAEPAEVRRLGGVPRDLVDHRLPADRPLAVGACGLADHARRAGLGRRDGRARLGRRGRPRPAPRPRPASGVAGPRATAALDPAGHHRRRDPVVRLVRLQRRRRAAGQRRRGPGAGQHPGRRRGRDARLAASSSGSRTVTRRCSVASPARSPGWRRSPLRRATSTRCRRSPSARSPASSATSRCERRTSSSTTTRST